MKRYYHLTSYENAKKIQQYGFLVGKEGMLGPGIYFAEQPKSTFKKSHSHIRDAMIVVLIDVGKVLTVENAHRDWNKAIVKSKGYDSVQKLNCESGPEICIYEPYRIKIIGIIHWNDLNIEFDVIRGYKIDVPDFSFLSNSRRVVVVYINEKTPIKCHFDDKTWQNYNVHAEIQIKNGYNIIFSLD